MTSRLEAIKARRAATLVGPGGLVEFMAHLADDFDHLIAVAEAAAEVLDGRGTCYESCRGCRNCLCSNCSGRSVGPHDDGCPVAALDLLLNGEGT